ncbi:helix-turn-helix transcriptional regulator [Pseudomonas sp. EKM23D]|uniref:helix-turn-helix domain-containing protein n=1 Tax=Pseudomonas sp. EKM23D TaxID=2708062 RepID=UPI00142D305D|nr:helix-turn-helix transcriptional regulator [Pseudomonas sp. EKM23D]KAF6687215.1 helix-turn-helix transcriptional regulator [Pseudomonas sp. EKM23D]
MKEITDRLREERIRLGLTQEELAVLGGVRVNAQSVYERGTRVPNAKYLSNVDKAGVDVLYVVTGKRTPIARVRS